jgi:hypothetical protein
MGGSTTGSVAHDPAMRQRDIAASLNITELSRSGPRTALSLVFPVLLGTAVPREEASD